MTGRRDEPGSNETRRGGGRDEPLQIDAPELLTGRERTRDTVVTAIMWLVYLYLWVPLISLFAWALGVEFAYDVMIRSGGAAGLGDVIFVYGVIVAVILGTVVAWSVSNKIRFGKLTRRREHPIVSDDSIRAYFEIDATTFAGLRDGRVVAVEFGQDGVLRVEDRTGFQ